MGGPVRAKASGADQGTPTDTVQLSDTAQRAAAAHGGELRFQSIPATHTTGRIDILA